MLFDMALFSGLRVFEIAALTISDLRLSDSEKLIYGYNPTKVEKVS